MEPFNLEDVDQKFSPKEMIRIIQQNVETIEYALRIEKIIQQINEDEAQRRDLVQAIGQLLDATSTRAQLQKALLKYTKKGVSVSIDWIKENDPESEKIVARENEAEAEVVVDDSIERLRFLDDDVEEEWRVPQRFL